LLVVGVLSATPTAQAEDVKRLKDANGRLRVVSEVCEWAVPTLGRYPHVVRARIEVNAKIYVANTQGAGLGFCHFMNDDGKEIDWSSNTGLQLFRCRLVMAASPSQP